MPHVFISYAKKDTRALAEVLSVALNAVPGISAWMDMSLEADSSWAGQIQHEIDRCDYMVVLLSTDVNRAVTAAQRRSFVLNEIDYAQQENKPILPVMVQQTKMPVQLAGIQYIDLTQRPIDPSPIVERIRQRFNLASAPESVIVPKEERRRSSRTPLIIGIVGALALIAVVALIVLPALNLPALTPTVATSNPTHTENALEVVDSGTPTATHTLEPSHTPSNSPSATFTDVPTDTPTPNEAQREGTLQAVMQNLQTEQARLQATADRATAHALTATADTWTGTPTPDDRATAAALLTATARQMAIHQTATADAWTDTSTPTFTSTQTYTPSRTPTFTPTASNTPTPLPTNTPTATADQLERSFTPVTANSDWTPITREFDGVMMVLVPAGRFDMGNTEHEIDYMLAMCRQLASNEAECERGWYEDESPTSTQIFSNPFWIDKYEVTHELYWQCVADGRCTQTPVSEFSTTSDQPINRVTWFQAQEFCEWREMRLPTEAEWEYAARGPSRLLFPWGNENNGALANRCDRACGEAYWNSGYDYVDEESSDGYAIIAPVGSYPDGASWVGALDLIGNVWEWTNSLYWAYPYNSIDGREQDTGDRTDVARVLRGGSFDDNLVFGMRAAYRPDAPSIDENRDVGFRCARSF
jgi:formylglycine-generating enzyme required for sulfatase activity